MHPISINTAEHYTWGQSCDGWHLLRGHELSVIQERMPPGTAEVKHYHNRSRQFFFVLRGTLTVHIDGQTHMLTAQHGLEIAPKVSHQVVNDTDVEATFLVISAPPTQGDRIEQQ